MPEAGDTPTAPLQASGRRGRGRRQPRSPLEQAAGTTLSLRPQESLFRAHAQGILLGQAARRNAESLRHGADAASPARRKPRADPETAGRARKLAGADM